MSIEGHRYFIINKPPNMVSQFISPDDVRLLGALEYDFPEGTHAIGRLDNLSEGLLILTTNKRVTVLLFQGEIPHKRSYLVKVKDEVNEETLHLLRTGVPIPVSGGDYITHPCNVEIVTNPAIFSPHLGDTAGYGKYTWLLMTLTEGKYHQVRKMVAVMRHRCQRLIRVSIEDLALNDLPPGGVREIEEEDFFRLLKIDNWKK